MCSENEFGKDFVQRHLFRDSKRIVFPSGPCKPFLYLSSTCDNKRSACFLLGYHECSALVQQRLSPFGQDFAVVRALMRFKYGREDFLAQTISEKSPQKNLAV